MKKIPLSESTGSPRTLIGFKSEDDRFDDRLEHDSRFLQHIEKAREDIRAGRGTRIEDIPE